MARLQMYIIAMSDRKKKLLSLLLLLLLLLPIVIVIIIVFIFASNNINRNCNNTQKTQLLQTITFIKRYKNQIPNSKHQTLLSPKKTLIVHINCTYR
jgi:hypothetical protein